MTNLSFLDRSSEGWVGAWSPGVGDPSPLGWFTTVAFLVAAVSCWMAARSMDGSIDRTERRVFQALAILLVGLGANKQLDLQSALTEVGRVLAARQGWYEERRLVQRGFVIALTGLAFLGVLSAAWITRRVSRSARVALAGSALLVVFVVLRAAAFHHVEAPLGSTAAHALTTLLELGGISLVVAGALLGTRRSG